MKKLFLFLVLSIAARLTVNAQAPDPLHDQNWFLKGNDTFSYSNDSLFKLRRIKAKNGIGWTSYLWGTQKTDSAYETMDADNGHNYVFDPVNGIMTITARRESPLYLGKYHATSTVDSPRYFKYTRGALNSTDPNFGVFYKYGYYELRVRMPQAALNSPSTTTGISWDWWTFAVQSYPWMQTELDICETDCGAPMLTTNVHCRQKVYPSGTYPNDTLEYHARQDPVYSSWGQDQYPSFRNGEFHVVSVEWTPQYVKYYLDGVQTRLSTLHSADILPSGFIINLGLPQTQFGTSVNSNTVFPYKLDLDYIKIWQLKMDCSTAVSQCSLDPSTFDFKVKKSIEFTGACSSTDLLSGSKTTLRATDYILIDKNFTVEKGAEFSMIPTSCQ